MLPAPAVHTYQCAHFSLCVGQTPEGCWYLATLTWRGHTLTARQLRSGITTQLPAPHSLILFSLQNPAA